MHIYVVVSIVMLMLFLMEQSTKNGNLRNVLFCVASFIVVGLLAFRGDDVGGDTINYCGYFTGKGGGYYGIWETNDSFETGFVWLCGLLMKISRTDFCLLFFTSLITMLPFVYLIWRDCKNSKILPLCLYVMVWNILSVTQTALRQNLSVSLLFFAYIFYTSGVKKKYKYILVCLSLIGSFISHTSSLVALPLIVGCMFLRLNRKTAYVLTIGSFVIVMVFKNVFSSVFDMFNQMMMGVEMASHMLDTYYGNVKYALNWEVSFNRLAPTTLLVLLLIRMSADEDEKSHYLKFLVIGASLYNIGASFPMMFRTVYPLLFLGILFVPSGISAARNNAFKLVLVLLMAFFIRNQSVYMKPGSDDRMLPYKFIWES